METIYFIGGIAVLIAVNFYAIQRINTRSYLHSPFEMPKHKQPSEEKPKLFKKEVSLTRSEVQEKSYVEWFTEERASTKRRAAERERRNAEAKREREEQNPAFVGVAIVHQEREPKVEKNVDRWFKEAANH